MTTESNTDGDESWPLDTGLWAFVAVSLALCLLLGSFIVDQQRSIAALTKLDAQQTTAFGTSHRAEDQLTALAKGVQQLSDQGDANATAVIAVLKRNGVNIKGNGSPPPAPAQTAP